jgi:1-acyl-sn-glycerol-3-phosphate acyltransferase
MSEVAPPRAYRFVRALARMLLRVEYRAVEVRGAERVPAAGPVILVANHQNSLVDSLALLVASPRRASPLAKAPLFRIRALAPFLRALGALPVHRPQDVAENAGTGARANLDMFAECRRRLAAGGSIVLFPEGVSQPRPKLQPLRTGAARIALDLGAPVTIVPVGLAYDPPGARRGRILVSFGEPFAVDGSTLGPTRRREIAATTRRIEAALHGLLAEAESQGDLEAMRALALVLARERGEPAPATLAEEQERTRAVARAVAALRARDPAEVEAVRDEADAFLRTLDAAGIPLALLDVPYDAGRVLRFLARTAFDVLVLAPLALLGAVVTGPPRALGWVLVTRMSGVSPDLAAGNRIFGPVFLLAAWSLLLGVVLAVLVGPLAGVAALLGVPLLFAALVRWRDRRHEIRTRVRAFALLAGGRLRRTLLRRRRDLAARLEAAAARLRGPEGSAAPSPSESAR